LQQISEILQQISEILQRYSSRYQRYCRGTVADIRDTAETLHQISDILQRCYRDTKKILQQIDIRDSVG
jgi:uncharacterized protein YqgV (UPF0045/DUF77 family)